MLHPIHRAIHSLTAARAMRCPHTQLRLRLGAAEIRDTAAALVSGLEAAATDIESGNAQDALAAWTRATDAVAVRSAEVCLPALVATDARHVMLVLRQAGIIDAFGTCYGRKALYDAIEASRRGSSAGARTRQARCALPGEWPRARRCRCARTSREAEARARSRVRRHGTRDRKRLICCVALTARRARGRGPRP